MTTRQVSTDALATLGTILGEGEKRDAIHLAVLPVVAGNTLAPGQGIVIENGKAWVATESTGESLGIVDPFLPRLVNRDERFWMILLRARMRKRLPVRLLISLRQSVTQRQTN